ncbi:hypothetical protein M8756_17190 [Lutimaribacter sp. EGI FJ00015]|uniref:Uncharacterized protein n=1 Tax=Lutimaribacter degradans TaxID=2945989 RepID=A0ACC6A0H1_9RHOB|nr:hypothetical protein [Lutimaribacter sp. EGI FJ00013]MCM2563851.1 hypothetical protein [Lutimaribacter sp. EGI FJ00013]MCO0615050.1 hypothetical protein [Lutimaribacter sp. EGI FJ00015]MCO0637722.1 hypothetical protein [Lutimaribacter sp. EGI FJ00014]
MQITFSPVRRDDRPIFARQGDTLLIDGEAFDFSVVPEGATLPAGAVASEWITGPVTREGGVLHLTLALSHGPRAPGETLFPRPVMVTGDDVIDLPAHSLPEEPAT